MKKYLTIITLLLSTTLFAQTELLENAGFEVWRDSPLFVQEAEGWTFGAGAKSESTDKVEGNCSFHTNELNMATNTLQQEISALNFAEGETYRLRIRYKVLTPLAGGDLKLDCFWYSNRDGELIHDEDVLRTGYFTASDWTTKEITTSVPTGGNASFHFRIVFPKNADVLIDDCSFMLDNTQPLLSVLPSTVKAVSTTIGTPVKFSPITIRQANLTTPVTIDITGNNRQYFTASFTSTTDAESQLLITYNPTEVGTHTAYILIDCSGHPTLSQSIRLSASCTNPAVQPTIIVEPATIPAFTAVEGKQSEYTVKVKSQGLSDYIYLKVTHTQGTGFIISNSQMSQKVDNNLTITFRPNKAGEYKSVVTLSSEGAQDVVLNLTGTATASSEEDPDYQTEFKFDTTTPLTYLNETFSDIRHNTPLALADKGWNNVVKAGTRPWWGYEHKEIINNEETIVERSAKATGYIHQGTDYTPWEMWLVTPALDFKNSPSQMFTFRVMGDLLLEEQQTFLDLYYIDMLDGEPYFGLIENVPMPTIPDENGEWSELHLDLAGQNLADVFFIGFKFSGPSGNIAPTVYYLDDITYGRTNIPKITPDSAMVRLLTQPDKEVQARITVKTANMTEPVTVSLAGPNAGSFRLSHSTLPAEGGEFVLAFKHTEEGVHSAYIKLASRGAADVLIPVAALNKTNTGIDTPHAAPQVMLIGNSLQVTADGFCSMTLYTAYGQTAATSATPVLNTTALPTGIYTVQVLTQSGTYNQKILIP